MTEKRFVMPDGDLDTDVTLIDTLTGKEYEDNFNDIVDLLNELNDENKTLKSDLKQIQDSLWTTEHIKNLEEENKELKLQLEAFKDKLCELGVSDVKLYGKRYYTGLEEWLE